mgnify:CR=1 FL=1
MTYNYNTDLPPDMMAVKRAEYQGLRYESDFLKFIFTQFDVEFMNNLEKEFLEIKGAE